MTKKVTGNMKKKLLIITILVLLCIVAIIAAVWKNTSVQKQKKQLELRNRYLEEMNYEQTKIISRQAEEIKGI